MADAKGRSAGEISEAEWLTFILLVVLCVPGIAYVSVQSATVLVSAMPQTGSVTDIRILSAFVAPFATLFAVFPLTVLCFGGRSAILKWIATVLVVTAVAGLLVFPPGNPFG